MKVYAIHRSGKKLWYPTDDALLCRSVPSSEIAARGFRKTKSACMGEKLRRMSPRA
jgi:hypothetical protein